MNGNVIGRDYVGLLVGCSYSTNVDNVVATGSVFGKGHVGGLAGELWNSGKSLNSLVFIGDVEATGNIKGDTYVGGLVGRTGQSCKITNSYVRANLYGLGDYVGGLVGELNDSYIINSYASNTQNRGGGLVGTLSISYSNPCTDSYWDSSLSGITSDAKKRGIPKTSEEMKLQSTYESWDFTNIWGINANINNGYPYLR